VIWGAERTKRVVELVRNLQKEQQEEIEYSQLKIGQVLLDQTN